MKLLVMSFNSAIFHFGFKHKCLLVEQGLKKDTRPSYKRDEVSIVTDLSQFISLQKKKHYNFLVPSITPQ